MQFQAEIEVRYKTMHRCIKPFTGALDAPSFDLNSLVKIDKVCISARKKCHKRDGRSRLRGLVAQTRIYDDDKPMFALIDRSTEQQYVITAKAADESTIRLLLAAHQQESLTVYPGGFCADDSLKEVDACDRESVNHSNGKYADGDIYVIPARAPDR